MGVDRSHRSVLLAAGARLFAALLLLAALHLLSGCRSGAQPTGLWKWEEPGGAVELLRLELDGKFELVQQSAPTADERHTVTTARGDYEFRGETLVLQFAERETVELGPKGELVARRMSHTRASSVREFDRLDPHALRLRWERQPGEQVDRTYLRVR
jgi:hypothetical protein